MSRANEQSMGITDDKAQASQSASFPKAAPTAGAVTGSGVPRAPTPEQDDLIPLRHLKVALQALAYLTAFSEVTRQPSVFDHERNDALIAIRGYLELKGAL